MLILHFKDKHVLSNITELCRENSEVRLTGLGPQGVLGAIQGGVLYGSDTIYRPEERLAYRDFFAKRGSLRRKILLMHKHPATRF